MPAGGWTDPKAIEEGGKIYRGEFNTEVNCSQLPRQDGKPVKKGARDLRDPKIRRASRTVIGSGVYRKVLPKDEDEGQERLMSEEQIWQVMAYENMFSHGGKPADHSCYKPVIDPITYPIEKRGECGTPLLPFVLQGHDVNPHDPSV